MKHKIDRKITRIFRAHKFHDKWWCIVSCIKDSTEKKKDFIVLIRKKLLHHFQLFFVLRHVSIIFLDILFYLLQMQDEIFIINFVLQLKDNNPPLNMLLLQKKADEFIRVLMVSLLYNKNHIYLEFLLLFDVTGFFLFFSGCPIFGGIFLNVSLKIYYIYCYNSL